ncbi:MAG: sulfotransferase [Pseudomonadota bacterium]
MKVIAISGSGRSGSTLLSLLLSQDPQVFNLGQSRHLWRAWLADAPCTSGTTVQNSSVYSTLKTLDLLTMPAAEKAFLKDAARMKNWNDDAALSRLKSHHDAFLALTHIMLGRVADATGAHIFIDSSKAPEVALAFSLLPGVELYVLNLVRDPRAVATSWYRKKKSISQAIRNARDWPARQRRLDHWSLGERRLTLRYEDLAANPEASLDKVAAWADLPLPNTLFTAPARVKIDWDSQHLFPPANERVLAEKKTDVVIAPSTSWQHEKHRWLHAMARFFAGKEGREFYP